jgi:thiamine pyrophosphate-dependent acetolactate synthase large subunit-like protein
MKLYEAVAAAIEAEATGPLFGLMGDANLALWGALARRGNTPIVSARHEAAAVGMADGWFRSTGEIGIATVTCGPGLTQVGTSLVCAERNRSGIVLVTGEIPAGSKNRLQVMNQRAFVESCGVRYHSVSGAGNAAEEIAEAFYAARLHRCPVVLNLPIDVQEQAFDWDWSYTPSREFQPRWTPTADPALLEEVVELLLGAERPVIIAGRGAKDSGARDAIIRLADRLGALLATSLKAKGFFIDHPWDLGTAGTFASRASEALLADADVVLGVGAELGYFGTEGGLLFPGAQVARIDVLPAPREIGVLPGLHVCGDARETVLGLDRILSERLPEPRTGWRTAETRAVRDEPPPPLEPPTDGLDPRAVISQLSTAMPDGVVTTCGLGHHWHFTAQYLVLPDDAEMHFANAFGAVGQALAVAIGAGAATPGRPHVLIEGDGSLMMGLQELETVVRCGQQLVVLVMNDSGFGAEFHKLRQVGYEPALAQWTSPDFVAIARAFGGDGVRLEREADIGDALQRGLAAGGLFLIDARVSPTALSDPFRKLQFGLDNRAPLLRRPGRGA